MRKRTKWGIGFIVAMVATLAISAVIVATGVVALQAFSNWFLIAILSAGLGTIGGVLVTTSVIDGANKRKKAIKQAANQIAENIKHNDLKNTKQKSLVKSQSKSLKCCKSMFKSMAYSAENNQPGILGLRYRPGATQEQINQINILNANKNLNAYSIAAGKKKEARISNKKIIKAEKKLEKLGVDVSEIEDRYNYVFETNVPMVGGVKDYRTSASLNNSEYINQFKSLVNSQKSLQTRYNAKNKNDFGYVASIEFRGNTSPIKSTNVMSNAEEEMPAYELLLLKDLKTTLDKDYNSEFYPFSIRKTHFVSASNKNAKVSSVVITTREELDQRINVLTQYVNNNSNVKTVGKNYLNKNFTIENKDNTL